MSTQTENRSKRALLIGINDYQHVKKLRGCLNDVAEIKGQLIKFGFQSQSMTTLQDSQATRPGILAAFDQLVQDTGKDDIVVIYYSGHGSSMRAARDDEPDSFNETLVTVESSHQDGGTNTDILDDEILDVIERLAVKTAYITLIFDCCYSGSVARNIGHEGARWAAPDLRSLSQLQTAGYQGPRTQSRVGSRGRGGLLPVDDKYVLISASLDGEKAQEKRFNGVRRGVLTHMLCFQMEHATAHSTYLDVFERAALQVTLYSPTQHPQLEGKYHRKLFGMTELPPVKYDLVEEPKPDLVPMTVRINSGTIHGTAVGDVWKIYDGRTKIDETAKVYGRAEAVTVFPRYTDAKILPAVQGEDPRNIFAAFRAVRQTYTYGNNRLLVFADVPAAAAADINMLKAKIKGLKADGLVEFVPAARRDDADLLLQIVPVRSRAGTGDVLPQLKTAVAHPLWAMTTTTDKRLVIPLHAVDGACACTMQDAKNGQITTVPLHKQTKESVIALLAENLKQIAQHRRLLSLENRSPQSKLRGKFKLELLRRDGAGENWVKAASGADGRIAFKTGERMGIRVTNDSEENIYINLIELGVTKRVAQIYPPKNPSGEEMLKKRSFVSAGIGGGGHLLNLPLNFPFVEEPGAMTASAGDAHFLLLVTEKQVNISTLLQTGARDIGLSGLEKLLHSAMTGQASRTTPSAIEDWTTVVQPYVLEAASSSSANLGQRQGLGGGQQYLLPSVSEKGGLNVSRALTNPHWRLTLPAVPDRPTLLIEDQKYADPLYRTTAAAFSPDGRFMFCHTKGDVLELWALDTGTCVLRTHVEGFTGRYISGPLQAAFSLDSETIFLKGDGSKRWSLNRHTFSLVEATVGAELESKEIVAKFRRSFSLNSAGSGGQEGITLMDILSNKSIPFSEPVLASGPDRLVTALFAPQMLNGKAQLLTVVQLGGQAASLKVVLWQVSESAVEKRWDLTPSFLAASGVTFTADARFVVIPSGNGRLHFFYHDTGQAVCQLVRWRPSNAANNTDQARSRVIVNAAWAVFLADGRFDSSNLEELQGICFQTAHQKTPIGAFMRSCYEPQLLGKLLAGDGLPLLATKINHSSMPPRIRALSDLGYTEIEDYTQEALEDGNQLSVLTLGIEKPTGSGIVQDLRVFREGQLVLYIDGDLTKLDSSEAARKIADSTICYVGEREVEGTIWLSFTCQVNNPYGRRPEISAYVFNGDGLIGQWVDGQTDPIPYLKDVKDGRNKDKAYLIGVGVNRYDDPDYNLNYAAKDAGDVLRILHEKLSGVSSNTSPNDSRYDIVSVPLLSDGEVNNGTKEKFIQQLSCLSGRESAGGRVSMATPDDLIIFFFAGHGYSGNGDIGREGEFYFLFSDIGEDVVLTTTFLEERALSSSQLSNLLRDIDAGDMAFVIDACHSAASVQGTGFRPGPLGGRGLGQMAYDKKMLVLAASQADDVALEDGTLQQGLLTYALVREGLAENKADIGTSQVKQQDQSIELAEWLMYAAQRVPDLYQEVFQGAHRGGPGLKLKKGARGTAARDVADAVYWREVAPQQPTLFNFRRKPYPINLSQLW